VNNVSPLLDFLEKQESLFLPKAARKTQSSHQIKKGGWMMDDD